MTKLWSDIQVYKKRNRRSKSGTHGRKLNPEARADAEIVAALLRELDEARARAGLSKETLGAKARVPAPSVRKLFSSRTASPTVKTLSRLARPLGLRVALVGTNSGSAAGLEEGRRVADPAALPFPDSPAPTRDDAEG
jgi:ribosome-binding protein aMBF1 (putative translation factor)